MITISVLRHAAPAKMMLPVAILLMGAGIVGCSTQDRTSQRVEETIERWQRSQGKLSANQPAGETADIHVQPQEEEDVQAAASSVDHPAHPYIQEALSRNPAIQASAATARAKLARIPQVTSLPDPVIRAMVRPEPVQTAAGDMYLNLGVSQTFPLLTKLERAGDMAAAETRMALEQLNTKRLRVIADVETAYWRIYRLDRYIEITQENRALLEDLEQVVDTQYQVGKVPQQDLLRVQTELSKLRDDEHRFAMQRVAAVAALNQLTDHPSDREIPVTSVINTPAMTLSVNKLVELASDHNPELAMMREQLERDRAQIELADLGYWPDLTVGFEWSYLEGRSPFIPPVNPQTGQRPPINRKSEAGDDNWAIMLQMNIPIWTQRIEAARRQARQQSSATQHELKSTRNLVAFRIFDAWSRLESQQQTLAVLDNELIPNARQTYDVSLIAYQAGQSDFLSLIDNWQRWLEFELMRHREAVDLQLAWADLQQEVGLQLVRESQTSLSSQGEDTNE
jgi:outer membrane protein TolC